MRIILIGLPGSGKSTLGKKVAEKLGLSFRDLDKIIEKQEGKKIKDIFETQGEAYFRSIEANVLRATCKEKNIVLATGGGAPCFHDNMAVMNTCGITIFLDIPIENLVQRLIANVQQEIRPMTIGKSPEQLLELLVSLYEKRLPFYQEAKFILKGHTITDTDIIHLLEHQVD